jgi:hypothetical protein
MKLDAQRLDAERRCELFENGCCVFPAVLSERQLQQLRTITDEMVDAMSGDERSNSSGPAA